MKTYRVPGTATEWSPSGSPLTVTRTETISSPSRIDYSIPVELAMRGETTRKGLRRVVIQVNATIPGRVLNDMYSGIHADPNGSTPITAHLVVQCPQLAAMAETAGAQDSGCLNLVLGRMLSDIIAVATNESPSADADNKSLSGLLANALIGSSQLDVISGVYGTASAGS